MKNLFLFLFAIVMISCNSNTSETQTTDSTASKNSDTLNPVNADQASTPAYKCYRQILQRDTFVLHIQQQGHSISGKLSFDNYEKDSSSGLVSGKKEGNIIKLVYSFNSEGMHSVMEEYFEQSGNDLIRGTGDIGNRGDTVYFLNSDKVKFNGGRFLLTACDKIADKYK